MLKGKPSEIAVASAGFSTMVISKPLIGRGAGSLGEAGPAAARLMRMPLECCRGVLGIESARQADSQRFAAVMPAMEFLDVVERDRLEALGGPHVGMAVGMVLVELGLEGPLAQSLVVIAAQIFGHVVDRLVAKPLEVGGVESRLRRSSRWRSGV